MTKGERTMNAKEWAYDVKTFRLTSDELESIKSTEELTATLKDRLAEGEFADFEAMMKEDEGAGEKNFLKALAV